MQRTDVIFETDMNAPRAAPVTARDKLIEVFRTPHRAEDVADAILGAIQNEQEALTERVAKLEAAANEFRMFVALMHFGAHYVQIDAQDIEGLPKKPASGPGANR